MRIMVDRQSPLTLARQIDQQIRQLILSGAFPSGYRLPSTRKLSADLSVSRNTVIEAYSQLSAEGYLTPHAGSGTVVAEGLHVLAHAMPSAQTPVRKQKKTPPQNTIDFRTGIPALASFPRREWGNLYREICSQIPASSFGYCETSGALALREAIAQYLCRSRGLSCDPNQIVITSGATQGLSLISHILQDKQKVVLVEYPTHTGLRKVITAAGCSIAGVPVDDRGLRTELLDTRMQRTSFIYTTPSHQYPTGSILPIQRRLALIRYAQQNNCYIVEDDYDGEFRYEGQPVSTLYELDPVRVIYLGSLSKILAPSLRLGFLVLPEALLAPCKRLKMYSDVHTDVFGPIYIGAIYAGRQF